MKKRDLLRVLRSMVPFAFIAVLYAGFLAVEYNFEVSPWVTRPLFILSILLMVLSITFYIAKLRRKTQRALNGTTQIVDEPIEIPVPSGALIVTDLNTLRSWKKEEGFDQILSEVEFSDLTLKGDKAWEASRMVGLSTPYIYDIPEQALPEIFKNFQERIAKVSGKIEVDIEEKRIPHIERARRALLKGPALFNIRGRELLSIPTKGSKMVRSWFVNGELDTLDFSLNDTPASYFKLLGPLEFHSNALVAADADALEDWDSLESRDGLYELVMSGTSPESSAEAGGHQVRSGLWRWSNVSLYDARLIGTKLSILNPEAEWALSPHGDEFFLASQLSLDPVATRVLPQGLVHAIRMEEKREAAVSLGLDDKDNVVLVRLSFNVDLNDIYMMAPATRLEKSITPLLDTQEALSLRYSKFKKKKKKAREEKASKKKEGL